MTDKQKMCLAKIWDEHGLETLADLAIVGISYSPWGAPVKIGLSFAAFAVGTYGAISAKSPTGGVMQNFSLQASSIDAGLEGTGQLGFVQTAARRFSGVALARDVALSIATYNECMSHP